MAPRRVANTQPHPVVDRIMAVMATSHIITEAVSSRVMLCLYAASACNKNPADVSESTSGNQCELSEIFMRSSLVKCRDSCPNHGISRYQ